MAHLLCRCKVGGSKQSEAKVERKVEEKPERKVKGKVQKCRLSIYQVNIGLRKPLYGEPLKKAL